MAHSLACLPYLLARTYRSSSWPNSFASRQLHSFQRCTKTLSAIGTTRRKNKTTYPLRVVSTKPFVYVQIYLDSENAVAHVGRMTSQKPLRVALYSRVSTKDKGQDVRNQTDQLREFCQRQGWQIVQEFTDKASGKQGDRAQFQAMFEAASRREFDAVLFWSLDRFTREGTLPTLQYLQRLDSYGVAYRSFAENWLDSLGPFKDVVLALLATLAKQERVRLSERVNAGLARARKEGRVGGRPKLVVSASKIHKLADQGLSAVEIGERLGCSRMTVARRLSSTAES
jgi:DNA invertase Pin-like site-specific DNA recombinase